MTNHWIDMLNADVVLIMGGNPAEDHPIAMNWLTRAKERGAYILHVDPRFNRTSSIADVFAKLRSGTDIAFVGGMINYAIEHNRIQQEYVREYTNASWIVGDGYGFADGLFAGYDPKKRSYDRARWAYALDAQGQPRRDPTLKHPRCVFQLLKQHFSRYDPDTRVPHHRDAEGRLPARVRSLHFDLRSRPGRHAGCTPWARRSTATARRTSAPTPSCSCCSATSASPAAASTRCAASPTCRGPRIRD